MKKKIYVIACAVLSIDLRHTAKKLGLDIEYKFFEAGLHNNPKLLQEKLQTAIDDISENKLCERIVVGYGVCGKGTIGIRSRKVPLTIPKVHDCIALFLGGDKQYKNEFKRYPGTYYLSAGWCEEKTQPETQRNQWTYFGDQKLYFKDLVKNHGEETAKQTFDFLNSWQKNYQRAVYIETGAKISSKYEQFAKDMAAEHDWQYKKIKGSQALIKKMLTTKDSTSDILFVPPENIINFNPIHSSLSSKPILKKTLNKVFLKSKIKEKKVSKDFYMKIGLGIDAGGTYTDTVVYDISNNKVLCKAKALTTKWDFTYGISNSLKQLDKKKLDQVELIALSTTLATNAIIENQGQKVGMIIMPPYGLDIAKEIKFSPKAVIKGQLEINGKQIVPIDSEQVKRIAINMVENHEVKAFAVSGYAGCINPAHEIMVKKIIHDNTGLFVTCGHELSETLNFLTRANTAILNARIIPKLAKLLYELEKTLEDFNINAPIVVVKGDGTLMSSLMAKQKPVETILSGPAASVAGAKHLTKITNALVVDMGGTTTDSASLTDNLVNLNEQGANIGGYRTHVKALEIRTIGLGGDSVISFQKNKFSLGPNRVAPIAFLGEKHPETKKTLDYLDHNLNRSSTKNMEILTLLDSKKETRTSLEKHIVALLKKRPHCIAELKEKTSVLSEVSLPLKSLEENCIIQRCGLTLTDLLHIKGQFVKWDKEIAVRYCKMFEFLSGKPMPLLIDHIFDIAIKNLTLEILKKQLDDDVNPEALQTCAVCKIFIDQLLTKKNKDYSIAFTFKRPVIGIGAPISFFLSKAVKLLGAKAILPPDADVANAIGAITSDVVIRKQVRITPSQYGGFFIEGIIGGKRFQDFDKADEFARQNLVEIVRNKALIAGTSCQKVTIETYDEIPITSTGDSVFMGRTLYAVLKGKPDIVFKSDSFVK